MMKDWKGRRVLILGAARQGIALARYLAVQGAIVTLNDQRTKAQLSKAVESLDDLPIRWETGSHPVYLAQEADCVCVSGGVSLDLPLIVEARRRGLEITNDSQIFFEVTPCKSVGITGSAGKTTTTTLVGRMADTAANLKMRQGRAWIGGNIGDPLISYTAEMKADDLAIVELSSFQLELMTISPNVAVVLNITPNHLDRHGTMEAYTAAKCNILNFQKAGDVAILNRDDPGAWGLRANVRGRLMSFGIAEPEAGIDGTYLKENQIMLRMKGKQSKIMPQAVIGLRGQHNMINVLAACAIATAAELPHETMQIGVEGFYGVPHRLELVRTKDGVAWYNDSIATAPERSIAAMRSFTEPLVLLAGGRDKHLPWDKFIQEAQQRVSHLIVFGEAADLIMDAISQYNRQFSTQTAFTIQRCKTMQEAISTAASLVKPGDVVLLSPGGTSFDEFTDFEERGEKFRLWVKQL